MNNLTNNTQTGVKHCFLCEKPRPNRVAKYRVVFKNGMIAYLCKWHQHKCKDKLAQCDDISGSNAPTSTNGPSNRYLDIVKAAMEIRKAEQKVWQNNKPEPEIHRPQELSAVEQESKPSLITIQEPKLTFDDLILSRDKKEQIKQAIWLYQNGPRAFMDYGINDKITYGKAKTMLFYGLPGTGKTATAHAIADLLGVNVGLAAYDRIENPYIGIS